MTSKRKMELRDAIILGITFLAVTIGNKYDISLPDWAGDFFEASDGTMWTAIVAAVMFGLRVLSRNFPGLDKVLHLGNVFPEKEIEHTGAEKLIDLHVALETGGAIADIEAEAPDSHELADVLDVDGPPEDDEYVDWATEVLKSLGE